MENQQPYIVINEQKILVTEEVYRAYMRPVWAERKRKERERRCNISNGKGGTKRCDEDCNKCDNKRIGSVLSLDKFIVEGFEVEDTVDLAEYVVNKILLEELYATLEKFDPDNRRIMELFSIGKSEREIATEICLSQKAINKRKTKLFAKLHDRLKNFN